VPLTLESVGSAVLDESAHAARLTLRLMLSKQNRCRIARM